MPLDVFYIPTNTMWSCNSWEEASVVILGFQDPIPERFNVVEYLPDGKTEFYCGQDLHDKLTATEKRVSLRTALNADIIGKVAAWPGSPERHDTELINKNKRNRL